MLLGFYPRPNRLNFESAQSGNDNQRSLTDIARDEKMPTKAHATISLPPNSSQVLNNQPVTNNLIHPHAGKTYSHTGGKGPAPPVPTFQTQQSAPQRIINDNIQVIIRYSYKIGVRISNICIRKIYQMSYAFSIAKGSLVKRRKLKRRHDY